MKKLTLLLLMLGVAVAASAYEYSFNWNQWADQLPITPQAGEATLVDLPTEGINILIHPTQVPDDVQQTGNEEDLLPNLHVWNNDFTTTWPGVKPTATYQVAVEGNESNKQTFYFYHFDHDNLKILANFCGKEEYKRGWVWVSENSVVEREINAPGTYFFEYNPSNPLKLLEQYSSFNTDETTFFVRVMDAPGVTPTLYSWNRYYQPDWKGFWNHHEMEAVTVDGVQYYKYTLKTKDVELGGVIISDHGNDNTKTADLKGLKSGTYYLEYYRNGYDNHYDNLRYEFCGMTGHYKAWSEGESNKQKELSFTTTNEHGSATLTIVCHSASDLSKIKVVNGELVLPLQSSVRVRVDDGSNLRQLWLGQPKQGTTTYYYFIDSNGNKLEPISNSDGAPEERKVRDLNGLLEDKVYNINNGTNEFQTPPVVKWESNTFYLSDHVKVYSEGISLEDLLYADGNVRLQHHKIDHPLVGVAVRNVQGANYLIARSAMELSDAHRQKPAEGQRTLPYEWGNPNMPQYGWVALKVENPDQYVGKKFDNVRGTYCQYASFGDDTWIPWTNPNMVVNDELHILGDESTTLNTYSLANLVQPKDETIFLLKPNLNEMCTIRDVMRSHGNQLVYVPDEKAVMSEIKTKDADGNDVYISRNNVYVENHLDYGENYSFASLLQWKNEDENYPEFRKPYIENDIEILGKENLGWDWKLYDKVYDFYDALVISSEHSGTTEYVYPLAVPVRDHMESNGKNDDGSEGLVLHIFGKGTLQEYNTDMLVSNSDYWSRYKSDEDRNVYRNDVVFSFSKPSNNHELGKMKLYRCDTQGVKTPIAAIEHTQVKSGNEVTNKFTVSTLPAAHEAQSDSKYTAINQAREPHFYDKMEIVMGASKTTIPVTDMFYSNNMVSIEDNRKLSDMYTYKLESDEGKEIISAVGQVPVYKTDVNVAGRATYTLADVLGDKNNTLEETKEVAVNFTPNRAHAVTEYRVLGGSAMNQECFKLTEVQNDVLNNVNAYNFLSQPIKLNNTSGVVLYVPEVYTYYNDNTYGCYKEKAGDASLRADFVADNDGGLFESNITIEHVRQQLQKVYHATLDLNTALALPDNDSRYMVRVWRKVGNEPMVLLNDITTEFDKTLLEGSDAFAITVDNQTLDMHTHYRDMDNLLMGNRESNVENMISDTFVHTPIGGDTEVTYYVTLYVQDDKVMNAIEAASLAGAPRRAEQTNTAKAYYVKKTELKTRKGGVITGIDGVVNDSACVAGVRYVNVAGQVSDRPWSGVNVVVTTLTDGTTRTSKMVK